MVDGLGLSTPSQGIRAARSGTRGTAAARVALRFAPLPTPQTLSRQMEGSGGEQVIDSRQLQLLRRQISQWYIAILIIQFYRYSHIPFLSSVYTPSVELTAAAPPPEQTAVSPHPHYLPHTNPGTSIFL
jgi:hypothetical protein